MQVKSPVGVFPMRITRARLSRDGMRLDTAMGAWRSEVELDRSDVPLLATGVAALAAAFVLGRLSGR